MALRISVLLLALTWSTHADVCGSNPDSGDACTVHADGSESDEANFLMLPRHDPQASPQHVRSIENINVFSDPVRLELTSLVSHTNGDVERVPGPLADKQPEGGQVYVTDDLPQQDKDNGKGSIADPGHVPTVGEQVQRCMLHGLGEGTQVVYPSRSDSDNISGTPLWQLHNYRVGYQVQPTAVVFAESASDVKRAVVCAQQADLQTVGQSGRHSYIAYCQKGCVLINVARMKETKIDVSDETAWLGAGLNLGQVYTSLSKAGLTLPGGTCPTVGLAGLTLGGGKGVLARMHGLLIDKLIGLHAVLSNGTFVEVSSEQNEDLLWLARGGGGNTFPGIVTSFHFKLVRAPQIITGWQAKYDVGLQACSCPRDCTGHPLGQKAFQVWQDKYLIHPDRRVYARLEVHPYREGSDPPYVLLDFKFLGMTQDEAEPLVQPALRALGKPFNVDTSSSGNPRTQGVWTTYPYIESLQRGGGIGYDAKNGDCKLWSQGLTSEEAEEQMVRAEPPFCTWDSGFDTQMLYRALVMKPLTSSAIEAFFAVVTTAPAFDPYDAHWQFYLQIDPSNGAVGDVDADATAYPWRAHDDMTLQVISKWPASGPSFQPTLQAFNFLIVSTLQPYVGTRSYYNYADDNMPGGAIPLFSYFGANAAKVLHIKEKFRDLRRVTGTEWELATFRQNQTSGVQPWMTTVRGPYANVGADVITGQMLKKYSTEVNLQPAIDIESSRFAQNIEHIA